MPGVHLLRVNLPRMKRWRDLRLRTKGLFVVAVPAGLAGVLAAMLYTFAVQIASEEYLGRHSLQVVELIQRLRTSEAELGGVVRAYFITADPIFADKTRDAVASFDAARQRISELTAGDDQQGQYLTRAAAIQRSRVERIFGAIARLKSGTLPWENLRQGIRAAETEREVMNGVLGAMEERERGLLKTHYERVDSLRNIRRALSAICVVLGVAGSVIASFLFASGITKRIGKLRENVDQLATGGALETVFSGRDEIGALGQGIAAAAEILRRRTSILENALHGIAEADASGNCLSYNKAYAELAGLPESSAGVSITELVHPDDLAKVVAAISVMRASGRAEVETRVGYRQSRVTHVAMTLLPVSAGSDSGFYIFLDDRTLRKETETVLVMAKDAAIASNRIRTQSLAKISHDIRTPLNAILGAADLLSTTALNSDQSTYVDMFQRNCRRLVRLINDFLDFSRIEAGAVQVQKAPCNVKEMVADAVNTFRESASRKGLTLGFEVESSVPERVFVDAARIQQVLVNLISNAVKFTTHGGVNVQVLVDRPPNRRRIHFAVSDTGPGIDPLDEAQVFAAFAQLPDGDVNNRGSGLGLTICRELVELMGGEIGLIGNPGSGSTFHFSLPLDDIPLTEALPDAAPGAIPRGWRRDGPARILVVEDSADNRILIEHYVRGEPLEITFAFNGEEAFEVSQRRDFDLVLMDIDLPGLNGYEITRLMRKWQADNGRVPTPVVALSAHAMKDAVRASLQAGCVAHVAKPVDRTLLLKTIARFALSKSARMDNPPERSAVADGVAALVPVYLASKPKQIEDARAALALNDFDPVRRFGHNLRGTGAGYGFPRIEEIGAALENAASEKDEESIRMQLEALSRFVAQGAGATPVAASS
jgi:PAS domain S-box-containing protein